MVTVLILLVVITLMGMGTIREGLYQSQTGAIDVGYNTCFTAAESGINAVYKDFQADPLPITSEGNVMNMATGSEQFACLAPEGLRRNEVDCGDIGSSVQVNMVSRPPGPGDSASHYLMGTDLSRGGLMLIYTDSTCILESMDMAVVNTQAWQRVTESTVNIDPYTN